MKIIKFSELKALPVACGLVFSLSVFLVYWKATTNNQQNLLEKITYPKISVPRSQLRDVKTEQEIVVQGETGKILVIYFSTGCNACRKEFDLISRNYTEISSKVKLYGVSFEQEDAIKKFSEQNKIKFPLLIDKGLKLAEQLEIKQFPTNLIIENGIIEKKWVGTLGKIDSLLENIGN